jgi:hypothetical protein
MKATAYFIAPVRGPDGDNCDPAVKQENVNRGIQIGRKVQASFPHSLLLTIPHLHEEIIDRLWKNGLASEKILDACCQIAATKDFAIVYDAHGITDGMQREIDHLSQLKKPIVHIDDTDDEAREEIAKVIHEVLGKEKFDTTQLESLEYKPERKE